MCEDAPSVRMGSGEGVLRLVRHCKDLSARMSSIWFEAVPSRPHWPLNPDQTSSVQTTSGGGFEPVYARVTSLHTRQH